MATSDPGSQDASAAAAQGLRPLSIGELIDRAFSICFKHFIAFVSLVAVVIIPELVLQYFGTRGYVSTMLQSAGTVANGATPPDPAKFFDAMVSGAPYLAALLVFIALFVPLANAAVVSGVSRAYLGMPVRWSACYADAIARWPTLLGLMLLWILAAIAAWFALFVGIFGFSFGLVALGGAFGKVGGAIDVVLGIVLAIAMVLLFVTLYLAAAYSFVAGVLERSGAANAFGSGFRRVFAEGQFGRSLAIGAAICGMLIGLDLVGGIIGLVLVSALHSIIPNYIAGAIIGMLAYPFTFSVVAVSYYDVRIRREGFDLQMLAAQLGAPAKTGTA
ncbi:MAG TPA: hypothetical protein VEJ20_07160 [Candidatus Eremiobacteraceae bacterium]|nr:hypothetical protein [Candidatus Eremiobacteraceae bacterium]